MSIARTVPNTATATNYFPQLAQSSYTIDFSRCLGRGSAADVYFGTYNGMPVAVKFFNDTTSFFELECANIRTFTSPSPHIVTYYGYAGPSIFLEYMPRGNLTDALPFPFMADWTVRLQAAYDIAAALNYLHERSLVHCDLRTDNVLVTRDARVKLSDFGLTIREDDPRNLKWNKEGEQVPDATFKSDVEQYGNLLLSIALRQPHYKALNVTESVESKIQKTLELTKDTPPAIATLMKSCLSLDPMARPTTAQIMKQLGPHVRTLKQDVPPAVKSEPTTVSSQPGPASLMQKTSETTAGLQRKPF